VNAAESHKLLVLTASPTLETTQSGQILREIMKAGQNVAIVQLKNMGAEHPFAAQQAKVLSLTIPGCKGLNRFSGPISELEEKTHRLLRRNFFFKMRNLAAEIISFARKEKISRIISFLDDPSIIWLTRRVAAGLQVDYATYASIVPEIMLTYAEYDRHSKKQMVMEFIATIKQASPATFATQAMADFYQNQHQVAGIALTPPLIEVQSDFHFDSQEPVRIGCLLNPLYINSLNSLINACQSIGWQIGSRRIALTLIGSATKLPLGFNGQPADIELLSEVSPTQVIEKLATCTFNFLPYWSSPDFSLTARLNLPDRIQLYLSAKRPLLLNTLNQSLLYDIVAANKLGINLDNLTPESFAQAAGELIAYGQTKNLDAGFESLKQSVFSEKSFAQGLDRLIAQRQTALVGSP